MNETDFQFELGKLLENFKGRIELDLKDRWNNWEKDTSVPEQFEVIGALMSRQITIAINFISCSSIWNGHIAPIIMRSMVDNYINFAWIWEKPLERSRQFIYYGLGQAKLQLEHRKASMENYKPSKDESEWINLLEGWINGQRYTFLTEVSLKGWSEISVRQMAEEANCIDLFNYAYQPFSSVAHNMWNHIGMYNLTESQNPLHKFFRKPGILKIPPNVHCLDLAGKYVDKMFRLFDKNVGYCPARQYSYDLYIVEFDELTDLLLLRSKKRN